MCIGAGATFSIRSKVARINTSPRAQRVDCVGFRMMGLGQCVLADCAGQAATAPGESFSTTPGGRKLSMLRGANDDDDDDD